MKARELAESLMELDAKAAPIPWSREPSDCKVCITNIFHITSPSNEIGDVLSWDADLIVELRNNLPTILRAIRLLAAAEDNDGTGCRLIEDLRTEADLCRNETATDIAELLDDAASSIIAISAQFSALKDERNGLAARVGKLEKDAERYRYLRNIERRSCLDKDGPEAGVWCDCEDENGNLILLTEGDLDAAIDAARGKP